MGSSLIHQFQKISKEQRRMWITWLGGGKFSPTLVEEVLDPFMGILFYLLLELEKRSRSSALLLRRSHVMFRERAELRPMQCMHLFLPVKMDN